MGSSWLKDDASTIDLEIVAAMTGTDTPTHRFAARLLSRNRLEYVSLRRTV